ncbi:MAG: hypothetical protein AAGG01_00795 [Planctomycetota bacterium]
MSEANLKEALEAADEALTSPQTNVPSLADLERRERRKLARRGGAALLVAALAATAHWTDSVAGSKGAQGSRAAAVPALDLGEGVRLAAAFRADLDEHLDRFSDAVAELRRVSSPSASRSRAQDAVEASALSGFRALHTSAAAGDESSIHGLRWIATRFEDTHGGRCARVFLDGLAGEPAEFATTGDAR